MTTIAYLDACIANTGKTPFTDAERRALVEHHGMGREMVRPDPSALATRIERDLTRDLERMRRSAIARLLRLRGRYERAGMAAEWREMWDAEQNMYDTTGGE